LNKKNREKGKPIEGIKMVQNEMIVPTNNQQMGYPNNQNNNANNNVIINMNTNIQSEHIYLH